ncbi:MAG: 7-cyano-7-deazaguanine synthase QueC [Acidiferrobacteraceae bacterium]
MPPDAEQRAVVLLSGGLDSATALAWARAQRYLCYALTIDYGQRHRREVEAARIVAERVGTVAHRVMAFDLGWVGGSALTDPGIPVPKVPGAGIPVTYVPARNTLFLSLALAWAEVLDARHLVIGVNAIDYSGYPDCRPEFIAAFERLANVATRAGVEGNPFRIHTPLLSMTKAEIIRMGTALGVDYALTVSCYDPTPAGHGCGRCDACRLRKAGFAAAGLVDPSP